VRYFPWCDLFLCPIYDFEFFVLFSGGRGGEGAATEPALRGGTADRKRRKQCAADSLNASMIKQKKKQKTNSHGDGKGQTGLNSMYRKKNQIQRTPIE